jgi:hypothetical protein
MSLGATLDSDFGITARRTSRALPTLDWLRRTAVVQAALASCRAPLRLVRARGGVRSTGLGSRPNLGTRKPARGGLRVSSCEVLSSACGGERSRVPLDRCREARAWRVQERLRPSARQRIQNTNSSGRECLSRRRLAPAGPEMAVARTADPHSIESSEVARVSVASKSKTAEHPPTFEPLLGAPPYLKALAFGTALCNIRTARFNAASRDRAAPLPQRLRSQSTLASPHRAHPVRPAPTSP